MRDGSLFSGPLENGELSRFFPSSAQVTIVRPFNTYGPRQSALAVIPTIITQLLAGATEIKLGSIHPARDFNYVKDTVAGFIAIAETQSTIGEEINLMIPITFGGD